jgi:hypothetical protein
MQVNQLNGNLAKLLGATHTKPVTKNVVSSQVLAQTLKKNAPSINTNNLTPKAKHIVDLLI